MKWLYNFCQQLGHHPIIIHQDGEFCGNDLTRMIDAWNDELDKQNICQAATVGIIGDFTPYSLALLLSLIIRNCIVVPISIDVETGHDPLISIAGCEGVFRFTNDENWQFTNYTPEDIHPLASKLQQKEEGGLIIFTSGSSGTPKAALLNTKVMTDRFRNNPGKKYRSLVFLKFDHIGGINTFFATLLAGGTLVLINDRRPSATCKAIEKHQVELLPTTPTFLNMLLIADDRKKYNLNSLKLITYGTEPMPTITLNAITKAFPGVRLKQTYGLTELGIFPTRSKDSGSTWIALGGQGIDYKVVDNILWIRSNFAMIGYLNAPSPFDNDGWFNTGDLVEIDGDYLRILGRKESVLNVAGEKVNPAEVENILLEIDNIAEVTVAGKSSPVTGQILTAACKLHSPEETSVLKKQIWKYCQGRLNDYKIPRIIKIVEEDNTLVSNRFKKVRNLI